MFIIKTHQQLPGNVSAMGGAPRIEGTCTAKLICGDPGLPQWLCTWLVASERMFRLVIKHQAHAAIHRDACKRPMLRTAQSWSGWKQALTLPSPGQDLPN